MKSTKKSAIRTDLVFHLCKAKLFLQEFFVIRALLCSNFQQVISFTKI